MPTKTKRCSRCHKKKGVDLFNRDRTSKDTFQSVCRACQQTDITPMKGIVRL